MVGLVRASVRALVLRPWFFDDVKQENPRPTARGLYNGFCLPLAGGAALGFCGARGGSVWRLPLLCVCSDVSRSAASCARGGGVCFWRLVALAARSQLLCGLRAEGRLGVVGDVSYGPSSAIEMRAGGMVALLGAKMAILGESFVALAG